MALGKLDTCIWKSEVRPIPYIIHKNSLKVDKKA